MQGDNQSIADFWFRKNAPYLSVNIISTKLLIEDTFLPISYWRRDPLTVPDTDLEIRGTRSSRPLGKLGGGVSKKIFRPLGPQFGLKISGVRAPRVPPLDPTLLHFTWSFEPLEVQCKGSTLISQLFKDPSIGPAPGIKPRPPTLQSSVLPTELILLRSVILSSRELGNFHTERLNTIDLRSILDVRLDQEARMVQGGPTAMIRKMTVKIQLSYNTKPKSWKNTFIYRHLYIFLV